MPSLNAGNAGRDSTCRRWVLAAALAVAACSGCGGSLSGHIDASMKDDARDVQTEQCGSETRGNGDACFCNSQCASGFCVNGSCCDSACAGLCMSCSLVTSLGTCAAIPAGVKPRIASDCIAADNVTCGLDGTCDGAGKCREYEAGTVCKPGTCDGDSIVGTYVCDGAGTCEAGPPTVCAPFSCDANTNQCFPTCTSAAQCVSGRKCVNGSCGGFRGPLCLVDDDCASDHCIDGICCNTSCMGPCRACNLVGLEGSCSPIQAGASDPECPTCGLCDGLGGYVDASADGSED